MNLTKDTSTFCKENVEYNEYFIHEMVYDLFKRLSLKKETNLHIYIPKIINYDKEKNILTMQKISGSNISDFYGEDIENVPKDIIKKIRKAINILFNNSIEYIDITGYNFMLDKGEKLWIIDFGHAICKAPFDKSDEFLLKFINGENSWNPEFR